MRYSSDCEPSRSLLGRNWEGAGKQVGSVLFWFHSPGPGRKGKGGCGRKLLMRSGDKEGYDSGVLGGRLGYLRPESSWT